MQKETKKNIEQFIIKAQQGQIEAFVKVYDELHPYIFRYIASKVSPEIAEDLTEETFFKAWKTINKYEKRPNCFFSSWVFRISHNLIVDYYRKHQPIDELKIDITDKNIMTNPIYNLESELNNNLLKKYIGQLSITLKKVVTLRFINELPYSEIARTMRKTEGNIRVLIHRGITQLREMFKSENIEPKKESEKR